MTANCRLMRSGFGPRRLGASLRTTWRSTPRSWCAASFQAFKIHYGLQDHDIEFFAEHGEADTEHSNIGYELVEQFATTNEIQVKILRALRKGLSIWWAVTDGVVREWEKRKDKRSSGVMG